jgi:hypothetical protein
MHGFTGAGRTTLTCRVTTVPSDLEQPLISCSLLRTPHSASDCVVLSKQARLNCAARRDIRVPGTTPWSVQFYACRA